MKYIDEAGTYTALVVKPKLGWFDVSEKKGTPYLRLPLQVIDEECNGNQVNHYIVAEFYLTEKTLERVVDTFRNAFGVSADFLKRLQEGDDTIIVGHECSIVVELESYNGKEYAKVKWLNNINGQPKVSSDELTNLIASLSKKAVALTQAKAAQAQAESRPRAEAARPKAPAKQVSDDDDDIPF
jgi:hypothetical protein